MNNIPSINQFLDEIDPEKTIDRARAAVDVGSIVFLKAIEGVNQQLSQANKDKLLTIAQNKKGLDFENIYDFFKQINKQEDLLKAIDNNLNEVKMDYLKTHLEALTPEKREKVLAKFPGLKGILSE